MKIKLIGYERIQNGCWGTRARKVGHNCGITNGTLLTLHLYVIGWHHVPINLDGRGRNLIQSNLRMWISQEPLVENLVELTKDIGLVTHSTWIQGKRGNAIDPRCRSSLRFIVPYLAGSLGDFEGYLEHHSRAQPWWPGHTLRYITKTAVKSSYK